jgi:hypothetical protein
MPAKGSRHFCSGALAASEKPAAFQNHVDSGLARGASPAGSPLHGARGALAQIGGRVKEPQMFRRRIAIRHARHVVANESRKARFVCGDLDRPLRPFGGHRLWRLQKSRKQIENNLGRLVAYTNQAGMAIQMLKKEALDLPINFGVGRREADQLGAKRAHIVGAFDHRLLDAAAAGLDRILDQTRDEPAHEFVNETRRFEAGIERFDLDAELAQKIDAADIGDGDQPGAQTVVDVVGVISDVVGQRRGLRLGAGKTAELEIRNGIILQQRHRQAAFGVAADGRAIWFEQWPIVLDEPFQSLEGQIEAIERRVATLQLGDNAKRLRVVIESAIGTHHRVERVLAGVAEGRMPKIMRQRQRFGKVVIETKRSRQRAGDLADFERMREPSAKMVAFMGYEDLRFVGEPAKSRGMDDAIAIALEFGARGRGQLREEPAAAAPRVGGVGSSDGQVG